MLRVANAVRTVATAITNSQISFYVRILDLIHCKLSLQIILALLACSHPRTGECEDALPPLELIRAAYTESVSVIDSIDYSFHLDWEREGGPAPSDDVFTKFDLRVVRSGNKEAIEVVYRNNSNEGVRREWAAFDGQKYLFTNASLTPLGAMDSPPIAVVSYKQPPVMRSMLTVEKLLGKALMGGSASLNQLLERPEANLAGWEHVGNVRCVRVDLGEHSLSDKQPEYKSVSSVWLDPRHGYLPKRIRCDVVNTDVKARKAFREMEVFEFKNFSDLRSPSKPHWIPSSGISRHAGVNYRLTLHGARVNEPVDESAFRPNYVAGTRLSDLSQGKPIVSIVGVRSTNSHADISDKTTADQKVISLPPQPDSPSRASARPGDQKSFLTYMKWFAIVFVVFSVVIAIRHWIVQ